MAQEKRRSQMETLMHCRSCGEDTNRADWEAAGACCTHCGEITGGTISRGLDALASLRRRLELELVLRPVTSHA